MSPLRSAVLVFLALTACGAPSVEEVKTTAQNLGALVEEGYGSVETSTNSSTSLTRLYDALNVTWRDLGRTPLTRPMVPAWSGSQTTVDTYKQYLMDRVFTQDNVESSGGGTVTFLVKGRKLCEDPNNPSVDPKYIDSCAKIYDDLQLRIVASGNPSTTVQLDIVLGQNKRLVATVIIEKDKALELQFHSAAYLALLQDQSSASTPMPGYGAFTLEGDFSYRMEKRGPKDFMFTYNTLSDVKYGYTAADGVKRTYSMAARAPMYQLHFDGTRGVQEARLDIGKATYEGVWSDYLGTPDGGAPNTTPLSATMQGFQFEVTSDAAPAIAKGSLSLGGAPSTLKYGATDVVSLSLVNPVGFTLDDTDGRLKIDFTEIDATAEFHLANVPGITVDPAWQNETYRVRFNGGTQAMKLAAAQGELGFKVVDGTFGVEALTAGRSVTASGGLCLVSPQMPDPNAVPLLKVLAAVPCP